MPDTPAPFPEQTPREPKPGCVTAGLGCLLVIVGIPMLICPGPGAAAIASGIGMIGAGLARKR